MQKELGQKDRLLQQQQFKLDEALRKVADSNSQQVWPSSKYKPHALWNLRQISTSFSWCYLSLCNPQADLQREPEHKQRFFQELTDRAEEEVRPKQWTDTFNMLFKQLVALRFFFFFFWFQLPGSPSNGYTDPAALELSTARSHKGVSTHLNHAASKVKNKQTFHQIHQSLDVSFYNSRTSWISLQAWIKHNNCVYIQRLLSHMYLETVYILKQIYEHVKLGES